MRITIHYARLLGKPTKIYPEGFVSDDGVRLKTHSIVAPDDQRGFSELWWAEGLIPSGKIIHTVTKFYFYSEWFNILELRAANGELLGHYSDICTPLNKIDESNYALTDLILDLWRFPDGSHKELDWDEFHYAVSHYLIPAEMQPIAQQTLGRLARETTSGIYPLAYIQ